MEPERCFSPWVKFPWIWSKPSGKNGKLFFRKDCSSPEEQSFGFWLKSPEKKPTFLSMLLDIMSDAE